MDQEFWFSRWAENKIGFHLSDTNPLLIKYWPMLDPQRSDAVFVPMCGKTEDLSWLATKHNEVIGVELSEIAVRAFFAEHFYTPTVTSISPTLKRYEFDEIALYSGDYFTAPLTSYPLIYDRAALIALPEEMRTRYVERLLDLLDPKGKMLLVTLDYPQDQMDGPPFSVTADEVKTLFASCKVTHLNRDDECDRPPKGKAVSYFSEEVWLIEKP
ncbi:thiopurine S-methyltransferase [Enterovibrio nigricans]|uniref:Thiopurine S-methyltransferase n=1 Tax=Enterovibrio nigricans DSM 22720 TaxID=1121868 RepID=A0A1T4UXT1_9GAMM|nr:thiopurine S-methyltransferase [Enterovibrio nigricans]PKF50657.1 thiopurine S-methyltransferase [Enterovibrio nigricans]SKA57472.1 thiopurine S-methyltransferase [Enterovibrio nigricans DSM 22720]